MEYERTENPLRDRKQTSCEIKRLVNEHYSDLDIIYVPVGGSLVPLSSFSFEKYFDYIRKLPYKRDKAPIELIGRPAWIMEARAKGMDCKKKACMVAAWLKYHKIPFRFIASSGREDKQIHHIFPQMYQRGVWVNVDATYSDYSIGQQKTVTAKEIL
jgi:hypothetical protein